MSIEELIEFLESEEIKEIMHTLTLEELRAYQSKLYHHRLDLSSCMEYRERFGDDNNPYLLEAKNAVVEESE